MALHSPFDLEQILVIDLAGSADIFSFIAIIFAGVMMSKFSLPSKLSLPLFALFGIIMSSYIGGLYVLIIILTGIVTFYSISKIWK